MVPVLVREPQSDRGLRLTVVPADDRNAPSTVGAAVAVQQKHSHGDGLELSLPAPSSMVPLPGPSQFRDAGAVTIGAEDAGRVTIVANPSFPTIVIAIIALHIGVADAAYHSADVPSAADADSRMVASMPTPSPMELPLPPLSGIDVDSAADQFARSAAGESRNWCR